MLKRLLLLVDGFTIALIGRDGKDMAPGDAGGEVAMLIRGVINLHGFSAATGTTIMTSINS
jgi:hypothetical protein